MPPTKIIKLTILACLIFISCGEVVLSISALENFSTLEHEGSNLSKSLTQEQEVHAGHADVNGTVGLYGDGDEKGYTQKQEIYDSEKSQRGKAGAYGGANIVHRPRRGEKSAASLAGNPRLFIPTLIFYVSFGLILVFPSY